MIGIVSFCGENCSIIEDENSIENALNDLKKSNKENLLLISQTTYSLEKFENIVEKIKNDNILKNVNMKVINTICSATKQRQLETEKLAKQVQTMIIIGGRNSSNSNKLYELAKKYCSNVLFIETEQEIDISCIKMSDKIGIMAGASTPQKNIEKVIAKLTRM